MPCPRFKDNLFAWAFVKAGRLIGTGSLLKKKKAKQ